MAHFKTPTLTLWLSVVRAHQTPTVDEERCPKCFPGISATWKIGWLMKKVLLYMMGSRGSSTYFRMIIKVDASPLADLCRSTTWTLRSSARLSSHSSASLYDLQIHSWFTVRHTVGKEWAFPASATHLPGWQSTDVLLSFTLLNCRHNRLSGLPYGCKRVW